MARKTLEEKRISDSRHLYRFEKVIAPQLKNIETNTYPLVINNLSKTILITGFILTGQIILFFFLKKHLIGIPGISY